MEYVLNVRKDTIWMIVNTVVNLLDRVLHKKGGIWIASNRAKIIYALPAVNSIHYSMEPADQMIQIPNVKNSIRIKHVPNASINSSII